MYLALGASKDLLLRWYKHSTIQNSIFFIQEIHNSLSLKLFRFLYGLLKGLPLSKCANIGCVAGAAAIQARGSELGPDQLLWLHQNMHSQLAASVVRVSAFEVDATISVHTEMC
jgi:hypothetical protein